MRKDLQNESRTHEGDEGFEKKRYAEAHVTRSRKERWQAGKEPEK